MASDAGRWQQLLDRRFAEGLQWARWAVDRWRAFPVKREPRPLVMARSRIEVEGGFSTGEAKTAFLAGRLDWPPSTPQAVKRAILACAESRDATTDASLRIERVERGERAFLTDRGKVRLPAWRLTAPAALGPIWLLDPGLVDWQPPDDGLPRPQLQAPAQDPGARLEVGDDDCSAVVHWLGAPPSLERYTHAETVESDRAVAVVARGTDVGRHGARIAVGYMHRVPASLQQPLGARVFVNLHGHAGVAVQSATATAAF